MGTYNPDGIVDIPQICFLTIVMERNLRIFCNRHARNIADIRRMHTVVAIERYRLSKGELPNKLDELVPAYPAAVPTDPFDGVEPLRYKKLTKGYVVYSVGMDGQDDGGDEENDITFTVER